MNDDQKKAEIAQAMRVQGASQEEIEQWLAEFDRRREQQVGSVQLHRQSTDLMQKLSDQKVLLGPDGKPVK